MLCTQTRGNIDSYNAFVMQECACKIHVDRVRPFIP